MKDKTYMSYLGLTLWQHIKDICTLLSPTEFSLENI